MNALLGKIFLKVSAFNEFRMRLRCRSVLRALHPETRLTVYRVRYLLSATEAGAKLLLLGLAPIGDFCAVGLLSSNWKAQKCPENTHWAIWDHFEKSIFDDFRLHMPSKIAKLIPPFYPI